MKLDLVEDIPADAIKVFNCAIDLAAEVASGRCSKTIVPNPVYEQDHQELNYHSAEDLLSAAYGIGRTEELGELAHIACAGYYALQAAHFALEEEKRGFARYREEDFYQVRYAAETAEWYRVAADEIQRDFELLHEVAKQQGWTDLTRVSPDFFALHLVLDGERQEPYEQLLVVAPRLQARIVEEFRRNPQQLFQLTSREFEEFIADLFSGFGYAVELTKPTRDKGRDVIAVRHEIVPIKLLIECKRYAPHNKVDLAVAQRLHGVTQGEGASKGIIATTSSLTEPARRFVAQHQWVLEGRDFSGLLEWLDLYQRFRMDQVPRRR